MKRSSHESKVFLINFVSTIRAQKIRVLLTARLPQWDGFNTRQKRIFFKLQITAKR